MATTLSRPTFAALAFGGALCSVVIGCTPTNPSVPTPSIKTTDAGVKTGFPKKKDLPRVIEQPATIEAFEETPLVANITGYVQKVSADIGASVKGPRYDAKGMLIKPGDVLAEVSVPDMMQELEQKKALITQAKAEVDQASAALEAAEAFILTAKAQVREAESSRSRAVAGYDYWKGQFARVAEAVEKGVLEKQVREETLNKFRSAEALREEVEAKVQSAQAMAKESEAKRNKAKADVEASKARVQVAEADAGRMAALVEYRFIRAPFDGVVTRRNIHTGHFIQPGAGGKSSELFVVARKEPLRIVAQIPEAEESFISEGQRAQVRLPLLKDQSFDGKVARTSWTLDTKSRTLRIEIKIDDPKGERRLRPGMYANVRIDVPLKDRWTLPAAAIFTYADGPCCWRVENGKAVRTPLKVGPRVGQDVEVLKMQTQAGAWEPITGKEEIIVANLGAVSEGKDVQVKQK